MEEKLEKLQSTSTVLQPAQGVQLPSFSWGCFAFSQCMTSWKHSCYYVSAAKTQLADVVLPRKLLGFLGSYCVAFAHLSGMG